MGKKLFFKILIIITLLLMPCKAKAFTVDTSVIGSNIAKYEYNGHTYAVIDNQVLSALTMEQLEQYCEKYGGHLVYIDDALENQFIYNLVNAHGSKEYYALGFRKAQDGLWRYYGNNNLIHYSNWYPGEPNNSGGKENYPHMFRSSGTWNDISNTGYIGNMGVVIEWDKELILKVDGSSGNINLGDEIELDVKFDNKEDIDSIGIDLIYDPNKLQFKNLKEENGLIKIKKKYEDGKISIILTNKKEVIKNQVILKVNFKAVGKGNTVVGINKAIISSEKKNFDRYLDINECTGKNIVIS